MNVENIVEYIRSMDPEQFTNIRDEEMEVDFEGIMDDSKEVLSNDTDYASSNEHDTDHAEKFVPSPEIRERSY